jgi:hypothetical protein
LVFWQVNSAGAANERQKEISGDFPTDFTGKRLKSKVTARSARYLAFAARAATF